MFPRGVLSSSGTSDLLFLQPVCLLGDRQMRTVPCALGLSNVIWVELGGGRGQGGGV